MIWERRQLGKVSFLFILWSDMWVPTPYSFFKFFMIDQHSSLWEKFLKKWFWLYMFSFIIAPLAYIIKIIISWELSVSDVWVLYGTISLITLLAAYNDLWMTESLKHFIPQFVTEKRYDKVKTILLYALTIQIVSSLTIAVFFFYGADYIAVNYFQTPWATETLKIFALFFVWLNIFQTINQFFIAIQDTFYHKLTEFMRMLFVLFSVLFIFFGDISSLENYSYSWMVWLYLWIFISLFVLYKKYYLTFLSHEPLVKEITFIKNILRYALVVFLWASAGTILSQIDMQMIILLLGTTEAWYYTNYLSIIWIPFILIWPLAFWFLFPLFSELHAKWEHQKILLVKKVIQKVFIIIGITINSFFFIFAENIATILFGQKFLESWMILKYSVLLLVFNFLMQVNFNIMSWIGQVKDRVTIISIAIVFNTLLNYILITNIWVYWAAAATWVWWLLIWFLSEFYLWKKYFATFDMFSIFKNIFLAILCYIVISVFNIQDIFIDTGRVYSFLLIAIIFIWYLALFMLCNIKELQIFISEIKKARKL